MSVEKSADSSIAGKSTLQDIADGKPLDIGKLGLEVGQVASSLSILTSRYYALAELSFRRFQFIRQLRLVWRAHRTHKLYLSLNSLRDCLLDDYEKELKEWVEKLSDSTSKPKSN